VFYRLCVDVDPNGEVLGISWERHPDGSTIDEIHALAPVVHGSPSLGSAIESAWIAIVEAEGILSFP
jgi:hypothetical protein